MQNSIANTYKYITAVQLKHALSPVLSLEWRWKHFSDMRHPHMVSKLMQTKTFSISSFICLMPYSKFFVWIPNQCGENSHCWYLSRCQAMHSDCNNFTFLGGMAQAMMSIQTHLVRTRIIEENIKSQKNLAIKSLILQRNRRKRKIEGDRLAARSSYPENYREWMQYQLYLHAVVTVDFIHSNYIYWAKTELQFPDVSLYIQMKRKNEH